MKTLQVCLEEVETLADGVGYGIEPFIKRPVAILMSIGFTTVQSCEGHADRVGSRPWIDIDNFNAPHEEFMDRWKQTMNDPIAWKKLIDSNHAHQEKMEKLLEQSGFSSQFMIEGHKGIHDAFVLFALGPLEQARQSMTDFTEWLLKNEQASSTPTNQ